MAAVGRKDERRAKVRKRERVVLLLEFVEVEGGLKMSDGAVRETE